MRTDHPRPANQPLPRLWLLSDERNDGQLERALARLPRQSAFIFRHYHLPERERFARYRALRRIAKAHGHLVILSAPPATARAWRADGFYGAPNSFGRPQRDLLALATVHNLREIAQANRVGADAALLSPAFATRSHPGASALGPLHFRLLARHATMPVIALGGMTADAARRLAWHHWAAIDGLSSDQNSPFS